MLRRWLATLVLTGGLFALPISGGGHLTPGQRRLVDRLATAAPPNRWEFLTVLATSDGNTLALLADKQRFDKSGWPTVSGWYMTAYEKPRTAPGSNVRVAYIVQRVEINCGTLRFRTTDAVFQRLDGEMAGSSSHPDASWQESVPGTRGETIHKTVCTFWLTNRPVRSEP
jgi:hypothetical protein